MRIHGDVDDGFGPVRDAFEDNFAERGDLGAACAVYVSGRPVVDIWAGVADARTGRIWSEDTAAVIFSCSKGMLTICAYLLVQEGRLDLDAPVARYWPEFAQHGKEGITVRCLLSHRAGLACAGSRSHPARGPRLGAGHTAQSKPRLRSGLRARRTLTTP